MEIRGKMSIWMCGASFCL